MIFGQASRVAFLTVVLSACSTDSQLKPFASDGCSLFPDASLITGHDWCSCCFDHDLTYWRGGTEAERVEADLELRDCVLEKTGNEQLASAMHEGVKFGGSPYFLNWYRWGYGWQYERKYQALTEEELALASRLEQNYLQANEDRFCGG